MRKFLIDNIDEAFLLVLLIFTLSFGTGMILDAFNMIEFTLDDASSSQLSFEEEYQIRQLEEITNDVLRNYK